MGRTAAFTVTLCTALILSRAREIGPAGEGIVEVVEWLGAAGSVLAIGWAGAGLVYLASGRKMSIPTLVYIVILICGALAFVIFGSGTEDLDEHPAVARGGLSDHSC